MKYYSTYYLSLTKNPICGFEDAMLPSTSVWDMSTLYSTHFVNFFCDRLYVISVLW